MFSGFQSEDLSRELLPFSIALPPCLTLAKVKRDTQASNEKQQALMDHHLRVLKEQPWTVI